VAKPHARIDLHFPSWPDFAAAWLLLSTADYLHFFLRRPLLSRPTTPFGSRTKHLIAAVDWSHSRARGPIAKKSVGFLLVLT
jgi:hypothetical protein